MNISTYSIFRTFSVGRTAGPISERGMNLQGGGRVKGGRGGGAGGRKGRGRGERAKELGDEEKRGKRKKRGGGSVRKEAQQLANLFYLLRTVAKILLIARRGEDDNRDG